MTTQTEARLRRRSRPFAAKAMASGAASAPRVPAMGTIDGAAGLLMAGRRGRSTAAAVAGRVTASLCAPVCGSKVFLSTNSGVAAIFGLPEGWCAGGWAANQRRGRSGLGLHHDRWRHRLGARGGAGRRNDVDLGLRTFAGHARVRARRTGCDCRARRSLPQHHWRVSPRGDCSQRTALFFGQGPGRPPSWPAGSAAGSVWLPGTAAGSGCAAPASSGPIPSCVPGMRSWSWGVIAG